MGKAEYVIVDIGTQITAIDTIAAPRTSAFRILLAAEYGYPQSTDI
ncbi:MAG: hypothetical protein LKI88_02290 [Bifidobacterium sp.]|jgi:hypothetical protein|nr:hypothetical protein [Bifidobacterium sp.]MCI1864754.1 hypothetical protein [Bifidobacterium sp.]